MYHYYYSNLYDKKIIKYVITCLITNIFIFHIMLFLITLIINFGLVSHMYNRIWTSF